MTDKRFIEESFPVKEVSIESSKEKNIHHGHISTLHIWWARRPLASSRATAYAALIPAAKNKEDYEKKKKFIIELCKWENSLNKNLMDKARKDILEANGGKPPKVLDPFSGGGAIPLEALRLGCETYANDYNPVAVLIEKCTLEYPQKYGKKLVEDLNKWSEWVLEEAKKELEQFYPPDVEEKNNVFGGSSEKSIPVGYIWARTIKCQNPNCEAEIPLMRQYWLAKKSNKKVSLYPFVKEKDIKFKIVGDGYENIPEGFIPEQGSISKAIATCSVCGHIIDAKSIRKQFRLGISSQKMVVVVLHQNNIPGKKYRIATDKDLEVFCTTEKYLVKKAQNMEKEFGINPIPDEPIHTPDNKEYTSGGLLYNFTPVVLYGMTKFSDLFNTREKLILITFLEKVRNAHKILIKEGGNKDYVKAMMSYLGLGVDRLANRISQQNVWNVFAEKAEQVFIRQAFPVLWDYTEINPFSVQGWLKQFSYIISPLQNLVEIKNESVVTQSSASNLPYKDNYFEAIFTDPPYYDNVPYADLSDFFYVWLKRSIGYLHPDLFMTPLTPKSQEAIAELPLLRGMNKEKALDYLKHIKSNEHFEEMLKQSFKEFYRILKPNGVLIVVYAHKTTTGWESVINALLESGLTVTASWPIATEMKDRMRAQESAALGSSIYIVARKIKKKELGLYPKVKKELHSYLNEKLERLWNEGISGADFFIAAIGAGIEIFGEYEKIIDDEGKVVRADKLLEEIREISTNFAVKQILHNGFTGEISPLTRFYVLWRWNYQEAKVPFDEARKLSQSFGVNLEKEWNKGFIIKEKEFIKVIGPKERQLKGLEDSKELIDVLHYVLLLWEKGEKDKLLKKLSEGYGNSEAFYRVAQAVSSTLPNESKERQLLDGFLAGKEKIKEEVKSSAKQDKLGRWVK